MDIKIGDILYNMEQISNVEKYSKFVVINSTFFPSEGATYFYIQKVSSFAILFFSRDYIKNNFISQSEYRNMKLEKLLC